MAIAFGGEPGQCINGSAGFEYSVLNQLVAARNSWVGYFPTVASAWRGMTGPPLPGQTGAATATAANWKTIVSVTIPDDISGFTHRQELALLPPAWYTSKPPPPLPVVMMIGGEFGQPGAWMYAGNAKRTFDESAAAHGGNAPVIVFPDYSGTFSNDTECQWSAR
jgi:hypothetical protein